MKFRFSLPSPGLPEAIWPALAISVLIHFLVATLLLWLAPLPSGGWSDRAGRLDRRFEARIEPHLAASTNPAEQFHPAFEGAPLPGAFPGEEEASGRGRTGDMDALRSDIKGSLGISTGALLSLIPESAYRKPQDLDVKPAIATRVMPAFPMIAPLVQKENILLRVLINESGGVDRVLVVGPARFSAFDEAAVQAFLAARYTPGIKDGKAVKSQITVEVTFDATTGGR